MSNENGKDGRVCRVAGPVVEATGFRDIQLYDVVWVGEMGLVGEVIRLWRDKVTIQVYEETSGLRVGEKVHNTGLPLTVKMGPGLLGSVYDGLQRPLDNLAKMGWDFIKRGLTASLLQFENEWDFMPIIQAGQYVEQGCDLGVVSETPNIQHRVKVPPGVRGRVVDIQQGRFRITDTIAVVEITERERVKLNMTQEWPVRRPRPVQSQLDPCEPLITGTRVIDVFFPVAKGGTAIIPGGFGTGKTVVEQTLARWADVDVVIYVGCGERGNEMAEVLHEFPSMEDPRTGTPLIDRTVLIANTSNMPVAAREASIYTGITIAEYYRDMGYDVLVLADSTSRWGEALREISGRLEEIPGEEGYPAYIGTRLSEFYERAGRVIPLGTDRLNCPSGEAPASGSVTIVGAISPPGGDFSEPMTQSSMRVAGTFWALDYDLSRRRHFPAINWTQSYSLYDFREWHSESTEAGWLELRREAMTLLRREDELLKIVQLVGQDALSEPERGLLLTACMLREDFLQQSAYDRIDRYCSSGKAYWMLKAVMTFHEQTQLALKQGANLEQIVALPLITDIARMKTFEEQGVVDTLRALVQKIEVCFQAMRDRC